MKTIKLYLKVIILYVQRRLVSKEDIANSYNKISDSYQELFLKEMHHYNNQLLQQAADLIKINNIHVLDLAAGTGYNSIKFDEYSKNNNYSIVDLSNKMLTQARINGTHLKASYYNEDMLSFIEKAADNSYDLIICNWALKYQDIKKLITNFNRILKKDGIVVCIVNSKKTLPEINSVYPKLLKQNVENINKLMLILPNPRNLTSFENKFRKNGFYTLYSKEEKHCFNFNKTSDLTEFVTNTGALAGFDVMIDLHNESIKKQLSYLLQENNYNNLTHIFYMGLFKKR